MTLHRLAESVRDASLWRLRPDFGLMLLLLIQQGILSRHTDAADPIRLDPVIEQAEQARIASVDRARPSAVSVFVPGGGGGGSGVLISPEGYALTNFHVTSPAGSYMRCSLSDGRVYDAVLVGLDPVGDLAMIKLLGRDDFPYATFGDSLNAQPGDWCMVIGNPFLLATNLQPTVTWGILSGVGRYQYPSGTLLEYADCLQTDASINPGNSGGPLYDTHGDLLGIVGRCSFEKRGRVNVGVGYAISINQAKNFLGYLRSGRVVDHATLGATVSTAPDGGAVVSNVLESSDAYRRGLRFNAEILEIDGRPVATANDVQNVMGTFPSQWRVKVTFRHEGETRRVPVRLMSVHRKDELLVKMSSALPPPPPIPDKPPEDEEGEKEEKDPHQEDDHPEESTPEKPPVPILPDGRPKRATNPHGSAKKSIPKVAAEWIEDRRGYANYFFNRNEQNEFIESLRDQTPATSDAESSHDRWMISGKTETGEEVNFTVTDASCAMFVGDVASELTRKSEMFDAVDQDDISGILPALDAWRAMLRLGPDKFGETYYQGTMPLAGERPLRDCTVGLYGEMEVRWMMHPETGLVECIEVFAGRDTDPAELWIKRDDDEVVGLELRYGLTPVLKTTVESWSTKKDSSDSDPAEEAS